MSRWTSYREIRSNFRQTLSYIYPVTQLSDVNTVGDEARSIVVDNTLPENASHSDSLSTSNVNSLVFGTSSSVIDAGSEYEVPLAVDSVDYQDHYLMNVALMMVLMMIWLPTQKMMCFLLTCLKH